MSATPSVQKPSLGKHALRIVKLGISLAYLAVQSTWHWVSSRGTGVVLYYHAVPRGYAARFEEQMRMVAAHSRAIPLNGIDHLPNGTHSVTITFDDALVSFAEHAVPVLEKLKIPATVFVVVDALGTIPPWGESYYTADERVLTETELRALPPLIQVGSHTLTHPHLPAITQEAAEWEITESRRKLESLLQKPVETFSFPHGEWNDFQVAQCRSAGYKRVFTTQPSLLRDGRLDFVVGRAAADPWDWALEFRLKMMGGYCWESYVQSAKRRLFGRFSRRNETGSTPLHPGESHT